MSYVEIDEFRMFMCNEASKVSTNKAMPAIKKEKKLMIKKMDEIKMIDNRDR